MGSFVETVFALVSFLGLGFVRRFSSPFLPWLRSAKYEGAITLLLDPTPPS
jgi:hypothetical protein